MGGGGGGEIHWSRNRGQGAAGPQYFWWGAMSPNISMYSGTSQRGPPIKGHCIKN